jgi:uncharacterized repeat protein (TIGR02543 family)
MFMTRYFISIFLTITFISATAHAVAPAPVSKTGQTIVYASGDDGDLKAGVAWPAPRFVYNNDQTVTDTLTGLIWAQNGNTPGPSACLTDVINRIQTWQAALDYVGCLNTNAYLGYSDWALPNRKELSSLLNLGQADSAVWLNTQGFTSVMGNPVTNYWTSTTSAVTTSSAWTVRFNNGVVSNNNSKASAANVWPVRGPVLAYTVTYDGNGGTGSAPSDPNNYLSGATVTVLANTFARSGYSFSGWYPTVDGSGTVYGASFTMGSANTTLYAKWLMNGTLIISKNGNGTGSVVSNPAVISCGVTCFADIANGSSVGLTATPDGGSIFTNWTGCLPSTPSNNCVATVSGITYVTATFNLSTLAKVGTAGYDSLHTAYANVGSGAIILIRDAIIDENLNVSGKDIVLRGGYSADFVSKSGLDTVISLGLTISSGNSIAESVVIKGKLTVLGGSLRVKGVTLR